MIPAVLDSRSFPHPKPPSPRTSPPCPPSSPEAQRPDPSDRCPPPIAAASSHPVSGFGLRVQGSSSASARRSRRTVRRFELPITDRPMQRRPSILRRAIPRRQVWLPFSPGVQIHYANIGAWCSQMRYHFIASPLLKRLAKRGGLFSPRVSLRAAHVVDIMHLRVCQLKHPSFFLLKRVRTLPLPRLASQTILHAHREEQKNCVLSLKAIHGVRYWAGGQHTIFFWTKQACRTNCAYKDDQKRGDTALTLFLLSMLAPTSSSALTFTDSGVRV